MLKRLRSVAAVLFVGVFVFALAFTLVVNSAYADPGPGDCCEVWNGETLYLKGVWIEDGRDPGDPGHCDCAPLENPENCVLLCPQPQ